MFWAVAMKRFWLILFAMLGLAVQAVPASAAIQTFYLNCNTNACATTSTLYGTVTLTESGSGGSAKVTVSVSLQPNYTFSGSNNVSSFLYNSGAATVTMSNFVGGNFNATSNTNGAIVASPFSTSVQALCFLSTCFDYGVQKSNSSSQPASLAFDVTKSGGMTIADFQDNDGGGYYFAAQIRTVASSTLFWVAAKAPEPATWAMFFAALAGLTVLYRRRKLARA